VIKGAVLGTWCIDPDENISALIISRNPRAKIRVAKKVKRTPQKISRRHLYFCWKNQSTTQSGEKTRSLFLSASIGTNTVRKSGNYGQAVLSQLQRTTTGSSRRNKSRRRRVQASGFWQKKGETGSDITLFDSENQLTQLASA
jgi:hypothetical protein